MRRLHTYYKWQRRPYTIAEARQKVQFAEVTAYPLACLDGIIACGYMDLRKGINGLTILVQRRKLHRAAVQAVGKRKYPVAVRPRLFLPSSFLI